MADPRVVTQRTPAAQGLPVAESPLAHPAGKPVPAALSVRALCERLDISESTFHRMRDEDWMPRPIMLSPKVCRWIWTEVEDALRMRAPRLAVGANAEPEGMAAGRAERQARGGRQA